jgi:dihydroxy-acid dehydratase
MGDLPYGMRRSLTSYGDEDFALFLRKAFIKAMGYSEEDLALPVVGIANTFSGYNPCHRTAPELVQAIKRGVMLAGGLPVEFPTISLHESFSHPTSMLFRNLMAMDTEEMMRAQPMDAAVLIGGCDKTVPAQLMAAASANIPAGEIDDAEIEAIGGRLMPTAGTCMVMGTASTMACMTEALGMMLPGGAAIPAVQADRLRHAEASGRQAVKLAADGPTPDRVMTAEAISNALRVLLAIGGSTNGLVHSTAIAGRLGIRIDLDGLDRMARETPVLVDLKPTGRGYMEDLHKAGGLVAVLRELRGLLHLEALTVSGKTLGENIAAAPAPWPQDAVRPLDDPVFAEGGLAVLKGNLAPVGAIIKQSSASPELMRHEGRAVVFDSLQDLAARIDREDLDVTRDDVLVLRNAGPKGAPGMPESGYIPIPRRLARQGVKDMVRLSDARMSGTAFGTIVLHVAPEAAVGGPLAHVRTGDRIRLDVVARELELRVDDDELARRRATWTPPPSPADRGYLKLHLDHVLQADEGCDLDFLTSRPFTQTAPVR